MNSPASGAKLLDLTSGRRVALDSMVFIYHLAADDRYGPLVSPLFQMWEGGRGSAVASTIAILEILVGPLKAGGDKEAAETVRALSVFPNLEILPVTMEIAERAAEIRARHGLRAPDSVHVATALVSRADLFLTNDRPLERVREIEVLILDDFLEAGKR